MAKYFAMVQETGTGTGTTGNITLTGATTGYRTINAAGGATDDHVLATIVDGDGSGAFEVTFCKILSSTGLERVFTYQSTNSNNAINLSANTHTITLAPAPPPITQHLHCYASTEDATTYSDAGGATYITNYLSVSGDTAGFAIGGVSNELIEVPAWADVVNVWYGLYFSSHTTAGHARFMFDCSNGELQQKIFTAVPNDTDNSILYAGAFVQYTRISNSTMGVRAQIINETGGTLTPSQANSKIRCEVVA